MSRKKNYESISKYIDEWTKENYDRITIKVPKGEKAVYQGFAKYKNIVVAELNIGQFADFLQAKFPNVYINRINKIQGQPFLVQEIKDGITKVMEG